MPTLRIKSGGAWHIVEEGKLRVQKADAWVYPGLLYVQVGDVWRDSGYRGDPGVPKSLAVNAWDYDSVSVKWAAGTGGAPISTYEIQLKNQADTSVLATLTDATSPSGNFTVAKSTKYNIYIRSKTSGGLYSAWVGPLQIAIGKPAVTTYTTETATRPWTKAASVAAYREAEAGPVVPTNVQVQSMRYQISSQGGFTSILSPYRYREIRRWANGNTYEQFDWGNPVDTTVNVTNYNSNGGIQGMVVLGEGWSSTSSGPYKALGTITAIGTETYTYQQAHTVPAVANSYW